MDAISGIRTNAGSDGTSESGPEIDLEKIHRAGNFVVEQPHVDDFPKIVREKGFEELPENVKRRYFHGLVMCCRNYYSGYILKDPFGMDDEQRRAWQTAMLQKYQGKYDSFQSRSKLRIAVIQGLLGMFRGLADNLDSLDIHTEQAEVVRQLFRHLPRPEELEASTAAKPYKDMSFEEKVEITQRLDNVAKAFLYLVTGDRGTSV